MKRFILNQRLLAALLASVLLVTVALPGVSVHAVEDESTTAVLDATSGSGSLKAVDTDFNTENFKSENYTLTAWDGSVVYLLKHFVVNGSAPTTLPANNAADISFTVRTGEAETYYLWMRSAYYNSKTNSVLVSVDGEGYNKISSTHGSVTTLNNNQKWGNYGWTRIAVIAGGNGNEVLIKVNPYNNATKTEHGMVIDSFMVTTTDEAPEAAGFYVLEMPKNLLTSKSLTSADGSFTFEAVDKAYDYKIIAYTMGKDGNTSVNEENIKNNGDGTYTINNITAPLSISVACDHADADTSASVAATCKNPGTFKWSCTCGMSGEKEIPATGEHSWSGATCTEPKTCTVCGETDGEALGHDWVNGECTNNCGTACPDHTQWTDGVCDTCGAVCGHTDEAPKNHVCDVCGAALELPAIQGTNTRFGNELSILVGYDPEELGNPVAQNLVAVINGTPIETNWTQDAETGYYVIELTGISAKEIADIFTIVIKDADGNDVTQTEQVSLRDYAVSVLENPNQKDAYKSVVMDMLNYGAAAQQKYGYNTGNLANAGCDDYQKYASSAMKEVTDDRTMNVGGDFGGSSLRFNDEINIMFRFKISLDTYAVFTWKDYKGVDHSVTVTSDKYTGSEGYYVVELANELVVADARQAITCTIYNGTNTEDRTSEVISVTDSVQANVARVSESYKDLYQSFMKYADATHTYLTSKSNEEV